MGKGEGKREEGAGKERRERGEVGEKEGCWEGRKVGEKEGSWEGRRKERCERRREERWEGGKVRREGKGNEKGERE